jgi:heme oxygenase
MSSALDTPAVPMPVAGGFAARLRAGTALLHARAERTGAIAAMLRGQVDRATYALLLHNLLQAYRAIEDGLERHRASPLLAQFARPEYYRAAPLAADLLAVVGSDRAQGLALLPAGARYAHRASLAAEGNGELLIAHSYVRVLGDLSGGQTLARVLARALLLPAEALRFFAFPDIADLGAAKAAYRAALDETGPRLVAPERVLREAQVAFRLNIALSEAVRDAAAR